MPPKSKTQLAINAQPKVKGFGGLPINSTDDVAPPANPTIGAPYDLALTTAIGYSSASPTAVIDATWKRPLYSNPANYTIQVSTASTFTASGTVTQQTYPGTESAHVEGLLPGTLYYVRVRANAPGVTSAWSSMSPLVTGENRITTATDTVAASAPSSPAASFIQTGDLEITWVNPSEANFKDVQVVVRASAGGTIYRTFYSAAQRVVYTIAMNYVDTAGAFDTSLYVELKSRTFSNVLSSAVNTGLITKSAPTTPGSVAQSWSGDTGTAGADLTISWATDNTVSFYLLIFNGGTARRVYGTTYTYTFDRNVADNGFPGDPTIAYSIQAIDGLGLGSTAASGTATNAAPAAPTATLTQGAVSGIHAEVTSTPPADFWRYEYVFKRDGSTVATVLSAGSSYTYAMQGASDGGFHSWTVVIRQQDKFAQFSSTVTPAAVAFEGITLSYLREGIEYGDSSGTAAATLKAAFADGVVDSGGVSYAA